MSSWITIIKDDISASIFFHYADFSKMNKVLEDMLSIAMLGLAQGVDIRGKENVSPRLLSYFSTIRVKVMPLMEDRRMDKDIKEVKHLIVEGLLR